MVLLLVKFWYQDTKVTSPWRFLGVWEHYRPLSLSLVEYQVYFEYFWKDRTLDACLSCYFRVACDYFCCCCCCFFGYGRKMIVKLFSRDVVGYLMFWIGCFICKLVYCCPCRSGVVFVRFKVLKVSLLGGTFMGVDDIFLTLHVGHGS